MQRVLLAVLLATSPAFADKQSLPAPDARVELPELVGKLSTFTGKVIKIPGPLETKPSELYTCGHDKKQWIAFELLDRGTSLVAYCMPGKLAGCRMLAKDASIMGALVKVSPCKQAAVELLKF